MAKQRKNARQREGNLISNGGKRGLCGESRARSKCNAEDRGPRTTWRARLGVVQHCCVGGGSELLEKRDGLVAPQPSAASRSAATFPFARRLSVFLDT